MEMQVIGSFANRYDAGRQLARQLQRFAGRDDVVVLALPRGGVPVGFEVAHALGVPFAVFAMPRSFGGVGAWYRDFSQVGDAEVHRLLGLEGALA